MRAARGWRARQRLSAATLCGNSCALVNLALSCFPHDGDVGAARSWGRNFEADARWLSRGLKMQKEASSALLAAHRLSSPLDAPSTLRIAGAAAAATAAPPPPPPAPTLSPSAFDYTLLLPASRSLALALRHLHRRPAVTLSPVRRGTPSSSSRDPVAPSVRQVRIINSPPAKSLSVDRSRRAAGAVIPSVPSLPSGFSQHPSSRHEHAASCAPRRALTYPADGL